MSCAESEPLPSNILISHVYSADNKGDAALLSVLISQLRSELPNAALRAHTLDDVEPGETFDGVSVTNSLMHYVLTGVRSRASKLMAALFMVAWTRVWAAVYSRTNLRLPMPPRWQRVIDDYIASDLVVGVGGGYLRGRGTWASTIELLLLTHPIHLARTLGKPTVLSSMSVGPFSGELQNRLFLNAINKVEAIFVREEVSNELLLTLGVTTPVIRAIDAGFAFRSNSVVPLRQLLAVPPNQLLVGITVRKWLSGADQQNYERSMAMTADHLITRHGAAVVFIPQVTSERNNDDDRVASRDVYALMQHKHLATVWTESIDHHYVKAMFAELDLTIGTRFHSVIFSLTSLVPAIAIEYEHKTGGIMAELDLSRWVVHIQDVNGPTLMELVDCVLTEHEDYATHLAAVIPQYLERSEDAHQLMLRLPGNSRR